jgi:transposase
VATDILGVSGRAMLDALVRCTTDTDVLAELARGRQRAKIPALKQALGGRFDRLHAVWIGAILAHIDLSTSRLKDSPRRSPSRSPPFEKAVELLCTIPGVQRRSAETIVAEIGVDMSVFATAKHLASWATMCPGNDDFPVRTQWPAPAGRRPGRRAGAAGRPAWPASSR